MFVLAVSVIVFCLFYCSTLNIMSFASCSVCISFNMPNTFYHYFYVMFVDMVQYCDNISPPLYSILKPWVGKIYTNLIFLHIHYKKILNSIFPFVAFKDISFPILLSCTSTGTQFCSLLMSLKGFQDR